MLYRYGINHFRDLIVNPDIIRCPYRGASTVDTTTPEKRPSPIPAFSLLN